jgi:ubiquinone/menaquinone biosynthesis C-methylase UbiE
MSTEECLVRYYADRAREYERIYDKPERQSELQRLRSVVGSSFAGANVFEVACGTGYWTQVIARSAASVLAIDVNEEVLAIARSKPMGACNVVFRTEDAYNLSSEQRNHNGGFSGFWWSHVPRARMRTFLQAFHRALDPGAQVVFIDNVYAEGSSTPISRTDDHGNTFQTRRLADGSTHEVLKNFPSESELRTVIEGLGSDIQTDFLRYYWIASYRIGLDV